MTRGLGGLGDLTSGSLGPTTEEIRAETAKRGLGPKPEEQQAVEGGDDALLLAGGAGLVKGGVRPCSGAASPNWATLPPM